MVIVVTDQVAEEDLKKAKLGWAPNLQAAVDHAVKLKNPDVITVIPFANNYVPEVLDRSIEGLVKKGR